MTARPGKQIRVELGEYEKLKAAKEKVEAGIGGKVDWGSFLAGMIAGGFISSIIIGIIEEKRKKKKLEEKKAGE